MWFIIGLIYMNTSIAAPEILVYKTNYSSLSECQAVYKEYPNRLTDQLERLKPTAKRMSLKCVTGEQLLYLKNNNQIKSL